MSHVFDSPKEVQDFELFSILSNKSTEQLHSIIEKLGTQVSKLSEQLEEIDDVISNLMDEIKDGLKRLLC